MRTIALLALLTSSPALAYADSDGYYCHGPGYLAWETRRGTVAGEHVLHVVRFAHAGGVAPTQNVVMPEFQVHGMVCGPQAIEVAGWTTSYRVDLTDQHRPMVTSEPAVFDASRTPQQNLGFAARAGITELAADRRTGEFELVIMRVSRRVHGGMDHHTVARLVHRERGPGPRIVASLVLVEGIFRETAE